MAAPVLVLAAIAAVTALVKQDKLPSWLDWLPLGAAPVTAAVLAVLGTWWAEPWAKRQQDKIKQQQDSLELLRRHLQPPIGEASAQALSLRVHPATPLPDDHANAHRQTVAVEQAGRRRRGFFRRRQPLRSGPDRDLPLFVKRDRSPDIDKWIQATRETGGFLLLVGDSCVGKTRLLYESARQFSDFAVLTPPLGYGELVNTAADATSELPKLIVWLDEMQTFLDGPYHESYKAEGHCAVTPEAVRRLLDAPTPMILMGTLWPEYARALRATQQDPATGQDRARYPRTVEILSDSRLREIGLKTFSTTERTAAAQLAAQDPRLAQALADRNYNVTEALAGAPELVRRYERATETQQAVIHAAVDARRLGIQALLTRDLLCTAARGYLTTLHPDDAWFGAAIKEITSATQPQDRATAPLIPVLNDQHTEVIGYTVADYLLQHLTRQRRSTRLSAVTWQTLTDYPHTAADLERLAASARRRMLYRYAEPLYQALADAGDGSAEVRLVDLLAQQGRTEEALDLLRQHADAGTLASSWLAKLLAQQGRTDELRQRADAGDPFAADRLADLLAQQGRTDELCNEVNAGAAGAAVRLIEVLASAKETKEEAERLRRFGLNPDGTIAERD